MNVCILSRTADKDPRNQEDRIILTLAVDHDFTKTRTETGGRFPADQCIRWVAEHVCKYLAKAT